MQIDKSRFFKPNFQNLLSQFEKKQPILPIIVFQICLKKVFNFSHKLTNLAFSSQICKTFCQNLKKSSLFYLLFSFRLSFLKGSVISQANWQIPLFQAKFSKLFATIWKKAAHFTYYSVLVPYFQRKSL